MLIWKYSRVCKTAFELYRSAQTALRGGDEELAFVFFMRYCNIICELQKKSDFRTNQPEYTPLFGGNDSLMKALNAAEDLRRSLIARYIPIQIVNIAITNIRGGQENIIEILGVSGI